jgi:phosphohistidine phosphatase SixA
MQAKLLLLFTTFLFLLLSCSESKQPMNIYWVRHAEKDLKDTSNNPPLTAKGRERAIDLRNLLDTQKIAAIYSTSYDRNIQTVMPLASDQGLDIQSYEANQWQTMIDTVPRSFAGKTIIICGHSNNILPMIQSFGITTERDELDHEEYGTIHLLKGINRDPKLVILEY